MKKERDRNGTECKGSKRIDMTEKEEGKMILEFVSDEEIDGHLTRSEIKEENKVKRWKEDIRREERGWK